MRIENSTCEGMILIDCSICAEMFEIPDYRNDQFAGTVQSILERERLCPECIAKRESEKLLAEESARKQEIAEHLPDLLEKCGIPPGYIRDRETGEILEKPPVYFTAAWLWQNRENNVLLSGETGCGKSTSACFVASKLLLDGKRIRYTSLRKLLADWRNAKTSDSSYADEKLLAEIFRQDIFIIDEVIGKARVSLSGEELLFELLESVNSGVCRSRIWLLGNFYAGSIEDTFSEPEPIRRRLQENFVCTSVIGDQLERMTVWKKK